jgi:hypothetical protein
MFSAPDDLKNYLNNSSVVKTQSLITAEWNLNTAVNTLMVGNYRYRPTDTGSSFHTINPIFDEADVDGSFTGATDSHIVHNSGYTYDDSGTEIPAIFQSQQDQRKLLFSLDDCLKRFRPRSGINKLTNLPPNYFLYLKEPKDLAKRPRYYAADKEDAFKYWTSYRIDSSSGTNVERGISLYTGTGSNDIEDTAPFVVYNNLVPTNRIIIKMQTNTGTTDYGTVSTSTNETLSDPFYGTANRTVPKVWKVQYLDSSNTWADAWASSDPTQIGADGYVELQYGLANIPSQFASTFLYVKDYANATALPTESIYGYAYLVGSSSTSAGTYYVWNGIGYDQFVPSYGWYLNNEYSDNVNSRTQFVNDLTSPIGYTDSGTKIYRELQYLKGLRIVVDSMNKPDCTFDLIELSPRLAINLTDKTTGVSVKNSGADLGSGGLPVGQLLASTGSLELFDYDEAFNQNNPNSILNVKSGSPETSSTIVYSFSNINLQVKVYETVFTDTANYTIPIKTFFLDGFPQESIKDKKISMSLRDMFFHFENTTAPQLLIPETSLSFAIAMLLDSIGFSNYTFKRVADEKEPVIPYFFIDPNKTVAEVLQALAVSTQSAMFFDEYNNFVVMSKNYLLPTLDNRPTTDITLYGSETNERIDVTIENPVRTSLANIIDIASETKDVYNDGKINYDVMYVQKAQGSLLDASKAESLKGWKYSPVLLWEVTAENNVSIKNEQPAGTQASYILSALPLNSDLSDTVPYVDDSGVIQNNIIDFGLDAMLSAFSLSRYNGYFYANGEIIKYDSIQYNVNLTSSQVTSVWISSVLEYQDYFSKIAFNGKLYPTGKVRIFTEPFYNEDGTFKSGAVSKHGRGQFGTEVVSHSAGLSAHWTNSDNQKGCFMKSEYLFQDKTLPTLTSLSSPGKNVTINSKSHSADNLAKNTAVTSIIRSQNTKTLTENEVNKFKIAKNGSVQSSALVLDGPTYLSYINPQDFISYIYKPLTDDFRHIGTRLRIVGSSMTGKEKQQTPKGKSPYFTNSKGRTISGASGGLGILVNPKNNNGYYLELAALSDQGADGINDIYFYKIQNQKVNDDSSNYAVPILLWKDLIGVNTNPGQFAGQDRTSSDTVISVYDIAVEYAKPKGSPAGTLQFKIYVNDKLITTITDYDGLSNAHHNIALFNRGSARLMFENVYAVTNNYSENTELLSSTPVDTIFGYEDMNVSDAFRKYSFSGLLKSTYLNGISTSGKNKFKLYFEEFGTILRECAYFNIKYDKAYPALSAKISPLLSYTKNFVTSGFKPNAYGAEFLIFNSTDVPLILDGKNKDYLRIQGVSFTQQGNHTLTLDEYFSQKSDFSNVDNSYNKVTGNKDYTTIKNSRSTYGKKDFTLDAPYIQSQDAAEEMMEWMVSKIMKPKKSIGLSIFYNPLIQLGDIVKINYTNSSDSISYNELVGSLDTRFVVYHIEYDSSGEGPNMNLYLSEVE